LHELLSFPATAEYTAEPIVQQPSTKLIEPSDYIFVYGSLMRGQQRSQVLENEAFEGEAYITDAELFDTGYGFPVLFCGREGMVWGEVYKISHPAVWAAIDRLENGLYFRIARRVHLPGRAPMSRHPLAQLYVGDPKIFDVKHLKPIPNGRWRENAAT
jgi:gamma-glutamylcyclotransferase (GGCT)/AIG2-like uncharacterized protein YtfP